MWTEWQVFLFQIWLLVWLSIFVDYTWVQIRLAAQQMGGKDEA